MKNKQFVILVNHPDRYLYNCFKSKPLVETFEKLAQYALTKETVLLVRSEHATIGVSRPNERYWFYISWKDGIAQIKFQHWEQSEDFKKTRIKEYKRACDEVAELYQKTPEAFFTGTHKEKLASTFPLKETSAQLGTMTMLPCNSLSPQGWINSCENCYLKQSEQCSSLKGELCEDYEAGFTISKEEVELWPTKMDASKITESIGKKQEKQKW